MDFQAVISLLHDYGYAALFFSLFLGVVGMPIPDEALAMFGGFVSSRGLLRTVPALLVTYAGVVSGLNIGYWVGRFFGVSLLNSLTTRSPRLQSHVQRARTLLDRYGRAAIFLSYFLPGVRHVVPYLVGLAGMPFGLFLVQSFPGSALWVLTYFWLGYLLGDNWYELANTLRTWSVYLTVGIVGLGVIYYLALARRKSTPTSHGSGQKPPGPDRC